MKVLDPGHYFHLNVLDAEKGCESATLRFVKREGPGYPGNVGHHGGTTMQEVLRALISRAMYVNGQIQDDNTEEAIYHMTQAIYKLEVRAALRHSRPVDFTPVEAVTGPTCPNCGHIHCHETCSDQHNNEVLYTTIILNGRKLDVDSFLTYRDIVALVLSSDLVGQDMKVAAAFGTLFTITWSWDGKAGSITKEDAISTHPGMIINAVITGAA
jgi:hypothetical protein